MIQQSIIPKIWAVLITQKKTLNKILSHLLSIITPSIAHLLSIITPN